MSPSEPHAWHSLYRSREVVAEIADTGRETLLRHSAEPGLGISIHLPWIESVRRYPAGELPTFLDNLLPEGRREDALIRQTKTGAANRVALLLAIGPDTIGDVHASPETLGEDYVTLEEAAELGFDTAFRRAIEAKQASSIPGVQSKISIRLRQSTKRSSRGILKLGHPDLPKLVENEFFFMQMAARSGISAAKVEIVQDKHGTPALWVERFDRTPDGGRLHVEDGCQLLDLYPSAKHRTTTEDLGIAVCRYSTAARPQAIRYLLLTAFSWLIANGDLHAKNVSILVEGSREVVLSPAYDLISTYPYEKGTWSMTLPLGNRRVDWTRDSFLHLGAALDLNDEFVNRQLDRLLNRTEPWLDRLSETKLPTRLLHPLEEELRARHAALRKG